MNKSHYTIPSIAHESKHIKSLLIKLREKILFHYVLFIQNMNANKFFKKTSIMDFCFHLILLGEIQKKLQYFHLLMNSLIYV